MHEKLAYAVGQAMQFIKAGSVEKVERQNARLYKIASLLVHKGYFAKRAAGYLPWSPDYGVTPKSPSRADVRAEVARQGEQIARQGASSLGARKGPIAEQTSNLADYGTGELETMTSPEMREIGQQPVRGAGSKKSIESKGTPSPISLKDNLKGVLSLDMKPEERKRIQQGLPATGEAGEAGAAGGQPGFDSEFWRMKDPDAWVKQFYSRMLGMTPGELSARGVAQNAGMGRAVLANQDLNWIKAILGGGGGM